MNWEILKNQIYDWDGSWRDIYIKNCSIEEWRKWIELVNQDYQVEWYNGKTDKNEDKINLKIIKEYWNGSLEIISTAKIFIDKLQINTHFFTEEEIENDIDPREFKSIGDHDKLINFLKKVSKTCEKPVFVTPENCPEIILMKVENEKVEIFTESR